MRIAIDYDNTYTRDPEFWDQMIDYGNSRGHEFICVTMRSEKEGVLNIPCRVIFTNRNQKRPFCDALDELFHV